MPEIVNTQPLQSIEDVNANPSQRETMIKIDNVSMVFNMASEQLNSLKEYAIAAMRRELRFREFRALDNISLEVKKGDVYGIVGTNGSGKSTLLKIVAGVLDPTEGTVQINGNIAPLIELGAGFDLELTARENIYLNGALLGYSKKFIDDHFDEIVAFAEIEKFLDMPMKNYSSGMVARIAFAIATVIVPDILIVDEVLAVGDFMFQQKCERRIMKLIKDYDVTVLIVSHSNDQIERLCNKVIWIEKGHTRMIGTAEEVCRVYNVLGGHVGTEESEKRVFKMLENKTPVIDGVVKTIAAEDRYGSAAKLCELGDYRKLHRVVIAPGEDASTSLIAASFAQAVNAPLLLSKQSHIPDATAYQLKKLNPETIYLVCCYNGLSKSVHEWIENSLPSASVVSIEAGEVGELATTAYDCAGEDTWGRTAIVTWDGCTGDILSFAPFSAKYKAPLFFNERDGVLGSKLSRILESGSFDRLLVLGGQTSFPDHVLDNAKKAGVEVVRICGEDPYDANTIINKWIEENAGGISCESLIATSIWNPFDALAVGQYAASTDSLIILEDPQNLDSVATALDYIKSKNGAVKRITFLGDHTRFTKTDKDLLGKAISLELR